MSKRLLALRSYFTLPYHKKALIISILVHVGVDDLFGGLALFPLFGFLGNLVGGLLPTLFARMAQVTLDSPLPYRNALLFGAISAPICFSIKVNLL